MINIQSLDLVIEFSFALSKLNADQLDQLRTAFDRQDLIPLNKLVTRAEYIARLISPEISNTKN